MPRACSSTRPGTPEFPKPFSPPLPDASPPLTPPLAPLPRQRASSPVQVAAALLEWGKENNATTITHWFQPMGSTMVRHGMTGQVPTHARARTQHSRAYARTRAHAHAHARTPHRRTHTHTRLLARTHAYLKRFIWSSLGLAHNAMASPHAHTEAWIGHTPRQAIESEAPWSTQVPESVGPSPRGGGRKRPQQGMQQETGWWTPSQAR